MRDAIQRVLDRDERIVGHGRCWGAVRRRGVPLLFQGRHHYDAFLTDRRLVVLKRRRRTLEPSDVVLVKRLDALTLVEQHQRPTLFQQRINTEAGTGVVLEWGFRSRALGWALSDALGGPMRVPVA
jgi:hypothetical protein